MKRRKFVALGGLSALGVAGVYGGLSLGRSRNEMPEGMKTPARTATPGQTRIITGGDGLTLSNQPNQKIEGKTTLSEGTTLGVRLKSDGESPFLKSAETTVNADGSFSAQFDLSHVTEKTSIAATVVHDGSTLATATGTVIVPEKDAQFQYDGNVLTLRSQPNQVVKGASTLPEGATLVVRLRSSNSERPFIKSNETTVDVDGAFRVTFDLSDIPPGTTVRAVALYDGTELATTTGIVTE